MKFEPIVALPAAAQSYTDNVTDKGTVKVRGGKGRNRKIVVGRERKAIA